MQEKITAALQKLGRPASPGELAKLLAIAPASISAHLTTMIGAGALKAAGKSRGRRVGLPDHDFAAPRTENAPPQRRQKHGKKHARRATRAAARPRPTARQAERFIPTVDAERRLVIVNGGEPHIYTDAQTEAIASLLFNHYDKA